VLESTPAATHRFENQIFDDRAALGPQRATIIAIMKAEMTRCVSDDQATKSLITDENVCSKAEHEIRHIELTRERHGVRELVRSASFEVEVGRSADAKGRIRCEQFIATQSRRRSRVEGLTGIPGNSLRNDIEATAQFFPVARISNGGG
jgi:hypothetical protein